MEYLTISYKDKRYPKKLLNIKDYPEKIYAVGNYELLNKTNILAMVGSRDCTNYGRKSSMYFAKELSKENICIVSGLAIGIDEASHIGALEQIRKNNCSTWRRF